MTPVMQRNGRRWSSADAYLRPARKRPNLTVKTGVQVLGIELDGGRDRRRALARWPRRARKLAGSGARSSSARGRSGASSC